MNIKQNKVIKKNMSGKRSSHTALLREKKEGLIVFFPAAIHSAPAGHAPRSLSIPVISWCGPATAEALRRLKSWGSHMDMADRVGDGLTLSPPTFPISSTLSGQKPALQFFPLE